MHPIISGIDGSTLCPRRPTVRLPRALRRLSLLLLSSSSSLPAVAQQAHGRPSGVVVRFACLRLPWGGVPLPVGFKTARRSLSRKPARRVRIEMRCRDALFSLSGCRRRSLCLSVCLRWDGMEWNGMARGLGGT